MMMMMMMMMMMKRLCSTEHSSYENYFLENNSLIESIYGKNHVGKIKDLFYCYIFRTCHLSNLVSSVKLFWVSEGQLVC